MQNRETLIGSSSRSARRRHRIRLRPRAGRRREGSRRPRARDHGVAGLYFLGIQWQYTRGSALFGWVKDDAQHLAEHLAAYHGAGQARIAV
jgi:hypothetical protein